MKDVGIARKKRNLYGRVNQRQMPPERSLDSGSESGGSTSARSASTSPPTSVDEADSRAGEDGDQFDGLVVSDQAQQMLDDAQDFQALMLATPLVANPATAYEAFRLNYNFDVQDLSALTSFHIGKPVLYALAQRPHLLNTLLGHRIDSYLEFIPSRYGSKPYFDAAVECLAARGYSALRPWDTRSKAVALRAYTKALKKLQEAVVDGDACEDEDLLAAVQMLGLREIVDSSHSKAYSSHVAGSSRLVRRRSPSGFRTEYQKLLFRAHMGPAFTEAMYNHEACYLESPEWMRLYESFAEPTDLWLSDRSELVIRIRLQMLRLNGLLIDVTRVMDPDAALDTFLWLRTELVVRQAHKILLDAVEDYKAHVVHTAMMAPPASELDKRREIYGTALECLLLYKRMLGTVCEAERLQLETETLELADALVRLNKQQPNSKYSWIYTAEEQGLAQLILLTTHEWTVDLMHLSVKERQLESWERWKRMTSYLHGSAKHGDGTSA